MRSSVEGPSHSSWHLQSCSRPASNCECCCTLVFSLHSPAHASRKPLPQPLHLQRCCKLAPPLTPLPPSPSHNPLRPRMLCPPPLPCSPPTRPTAPHTCRDCASWYSYSLLPCVLFPTAPHTWKAVAGLRLTLRTVAMQYARFLFPCLHFTDPFPGPMHLQRCCRLECQLGPPTARRTCSNVAGLHLALYTAADWYAHSLLPCVLFTRPSLRPSYLQRCCRPVRRLPPQARSLLGQAAVRRPAYQIENVERYRYDYGCMVPRCDITPQFRQPA